MQVDKYSDPEIFLYGEEAFKSRQDKQINTKTFLIYHRRDIGYVLILLLQNR